MENLNNTVIKVLNKEHGKKVIEYFRMKGINVGPYDGASVGCYYGVISGVFSGFHHPDASTVQIIELPNDNPKGYPKIMWVSQSDEDCKGKKQRVVFMEKCGRYIAWHCVETFKDAEKTTDVAVWKYAKDIEPEPEIVELTFEGISKGEGVGIDPKRIRIKE